MPSLTLPGVSSNGWIVLIGGGEFSFGDTAEIDRFLLEKMPADRRRIAFIPTASGSPDYAGHLGAYFRTLDPALETINVPVYRARDLRRGRNLDAIRGAGLVYVGGGVTRLIADTLRETATEQAMREALEAGALVAGIGAGAACLGAWATDQERPGGAVRGFGWIPETAIETGFDPEQSEPLRRIMSLPDVRLGIGIPRATALAIAPDRTGTIIGEGQVAIVRKA